MDAIQLLRRQFHRKAGIEINTLVIWIILLVFLALILFIIIVSRDKGASMIGGLCDKSGGLFGC